MCVPAETAPAAALQTYMSLGLSLRAAVTASARNIPRLILHERGDGRRCCATFPRGIPNIYLVDHDDRLATYASTRSVPLAGCQALRLRNPAVCEPKVFLFLADTVPYVNVYMTHSLLIQLDTY